MNEKPKTEAEKKQEKALGVMEAAADALNLAVIFGVNATLRESLKSKPDAIHRIEFMHEKYLAGTVKAPPGSSLAWLTAVVHGNAGSEREKWSWIALRSGNEQLKLKLAELVTLELFGRISEAHQKKVEAKRAAIVAEFKQKMHDFLKDESRG